MPTRCCSAMAAEPSLLCKLIQDGHRCHSCPAHSHDPDRTSLALTKHSKANCNPSGLVEYPLLIYPAEIPEPKSRGHLHCLCADCGLAKRFQASCWSQTSVMMLNIAGSFAVNPATGKELPIWAAGSVLGNHGGRSITAVPAHDTQDHDCVRLPSLTRPCQGLLSVQGGLL